MAPHSQKVAFAGLGVMGYGMAAHLVKSGFVVTGFDVHQPALERFVREGDGASAAKTPKEAARDVEFLICMVANSVQATPLLFDDEIGAVRGLKENASIVMCSTVASAYIDELQCRLKEEGRPDLRLIDSPVSGGAARAADGSLSIFASGSKDHLDNAHAILACMSEKLYRIPGGLGGGSKAKLIHQIFAGINIAMASEAMGLAAVAGLDTQDVFEKLKASKASSWMFEKRVPHMLDPNLPRYSAMTIIAKDVLYLSAITNSWGPEDDCVLVRLYLPTSHGDLVATQAGTSSSSKSSSLNHNVTWETIRDIMMAVHVAATTEAMSFCEYLDIDEALMYDIVSHAAGTSRMFEDSFLRMKRKRWGVGELEDAKKIMERLAKAVDDVYPLRYPLFLGGAALQEFWRQGRTEQMQHSGA
ncbi:MAG: hypothetical protein Q9171_004418 [Xanthocarpia ochracea]